MAIRFIDLRSDTITQPTPDMRQAMAVAAVGDDVLGDDPTVAALEEEVAAVLGKDKALFVPSGTMANLIAVRAHTEPGDEILLDANSHIYFYESGGLAAISGAMPRCVQGRRGIFGAKDLDPLLRPADAHFPPTRLVCMENTHNRGGGSIWPLETMREVAAFARGHHLRSHLDGARLWNACVATQIPESDYAACCDSVSVCFSKGLGAPVGSALAGGNDFILRARRFRKQVGGGMRQAGIIAAGALHALRHHRDRLSEDHANARALAKGLGHMRGISFNPEEVETNIVRFEVESMSAGRLVEQLSQKGVLMLATGAKTVRAVTHLMVSSDDIEAALRILEELLEKAPHDHDDSLRTEK